MPLKPEKEEPEKEHLFTPVVFSVGQPTVDKTPLPAVSSELSVPQQQKAKDPASAPRKSSTPDNQVQPSRQNSNNDNVRQTFLKALHSIVTKLFNPKNQESVEKPYQELMDLFLQDERFASVFPKLTMMFFKEHEAFMTLLKSEQNLDFSHFVISMLENGAISNHLNKMSLTSIITLILIMLDTKGTTTENQNNINAIVDYFLNKWEKTSTPIQGALFSTDQILFLVSHISDEQDKLRVMELMPVIVNNPRFSAENETLFNQFVDILLKTEFIEPNIKPHTESRPSANISVSSSGSSAK